eukprot:c7744_g1_i1.p1 GENE.c7744_g1_i1~~c7744_g1_i1.p1  ORF type:complete len:733 (-),score=263.36 c7744_g1_i1:71-2269(-)
MIVSRVASRIHPSTAMRVVGGSALPTLVRSGVFCASPFAASARFFSTTEKVIDVETNTATDTDTATNITEDETLGTKPDEKFLPETESVTGVAEERVFQAETAKLLEIVAKSIYTDKEVFIRELISNSADALEKLRYFSVTKGGLDFGDLKVEIAGDEELKTLTIVDNGIGMSKEELRDNLGTIARSGSLAFVKELQQAPSPDDAASNIIGRFGVGFYSVFMVGDSVKVYSRSAREDAPGYCWSSDGFGTFTLAEAANVQRGTKIIIKLKKENEMYASKNYIKTIVDKYSNFVPFQIMVNGELCNKVEALWMKNAKEISEQQHNEFYRYVSSSYDTPMYHLAYSTDVPVSIKSLFYVPQTHTEKYGMGRMETGVSLYSRRVLIKPRCKELLPEWLRFLKGVVDSEDIPLNISRENMQDTALMRKLNNILTKRALKWLYDESQADGVKFNNFFKEFGHFLKEGCVVALAHKESVAKLLRFESSASEEGKLVSLEEYVKRMGPSQKHIYYLCAPTRSFALNSPYYESFKQRGVEVFLLYQTIDDFVMTNLFEFDGKKLVSAESSEVELDKSETPKDANNTESQIAGLNKEEAETLADWLQSTLADRVTLVKVSERLVDSPAVVIDHESAAMRRMMKMVEGGNTNMGLPKQKLEINPKHEIIVGINNMRYATPDLAVAVANQVFDNALVSAGLLDDARSMLPRINSLLANLLRRTQQEQQTLDASAASTSSTTSS